MTKHTIQLTGEQIACLRESLRYSEQAIRDYDYGPLDRAGAYKLRNDKLAMLASTRQALTDGSVTEQAMQATGPREGQPSP